MRRIVVFAQVENAAEWERRFQTHGELFRDMTQRVAYYTIQGNEVAICEEVDDLEKYFEVMQSPAAAEAMAGDGVVRESVKVFVLDREFRTPLVVGGPSPHAPRHPD